jgi:hypothetical protein
VIPRFACPTWRWMTFSGTPSLAIFDRVRITQLMRRKAPPNPRPGRGAPQLPTNARRRQRTTAGTPVGDAKQRPDGHLDAVGKPRTRQLPAPLIHPDLAAVADLVAAPRELAVQQRLVKDDRRRLWRRSTRPRAGLPIDKRVQARRSRRHERVTRP